MLHDKLKGTVECTIVPLWPNYLYNAFLFLIIEENPILSEVGDKSFAGTDAACYSTQ